MKERLKSIPLWGAILSLVYLILSNYFELELPGWADISTNILTILAIIFGVANNPTDRQNF